MSRARLSLILLSIVLLSLVRTSVATSSTIAENPSVWGTSGNAGRKVFYARGAWFAWFCNGSAIRYSVNSGVSWSEPVYVAYCLDATWFSVWYNGSHASYARMDENGTYYRQGLINEDLSIAWSSAEQKILEYAVAYPCIAVQSDGKAIISYSSGDVPYVARNSKLDGTWTNDAGFPVSISSYTTMRTAIAPTNTGFYVVYGHDCMALRGKLYNGSLQAEENVTTSTTGEYSVSMVAFDEEIHVVAVVYPLKVVYVSRISGAWTTEMTLASQSVDTFSNPTITKHGSDRFVVTWRHSNGTIKYKPYLGAWKETRDLGNGDSRPLSTSAPYEKLDGQFGVLYTSQIEASYYAVFDSFEYTKTAGSYALCNSDNDTPIESAFYDVDSATLGFVTTGNVTISHVIQNPVTNPKTVTVNDQNQVWTWNGTAITLGNIDGTIRLKWEVTDSTSGEPPVSEDEKKGTGIYRPRIDLMQLGRYGLYAIMLSLVAVTTYAVLRGLATRRGSRPLPNGRLGQGRTPNGTIRRRKK